MRCVNLDEIATRATRNYTDSFAKIVGEYTNRKMVNSLGSDLDCDHVIHAFNSN